jgi:transposase
MDKYIGLDVHAASCTAAVIDARGKTIRAPQVLETNGQALVEFLKMQSGTLPLCLEEGTQSAWLVEILSPHVTEIVVIQVRESRGSKDDARDACALAERLRTGSLDTPVYKQTGPFATLRQLTKTHAMRVQDTVRVQNRIKALFRARGIAVVGKAVYSASQREMWLAKLPASSHVAALLLWEPYDAVCRWRDRAEDDLLAESHRHSITKVLESCPGLGGLRVAQLVSTVITPERFRTRQQFWSYCGLGIVTRSSSDWIQDTRGKWVRAQVQQTRGLNRNHNAMLKRIFKGAATTVIVQYPNDPLHKDYERLCAAGTKPNLAKVTLARKLSAIALSMWKHKEVYDPAKFTKPTSSLVSACATARSLEVR